MKNTHQKSSIFNQKFIPCKLMKNMHQKSSIFMLKKVEEIPPHFPENLDIGNSRSLPGPPTAPTQSRPVPSHSQLSLNQSQFMSAGRYVAKWCCRTLTDLFSSNSPLIMVPVVGVDHTPTTAVPTTSTSVSVSALIPTNFTHGHRAHDRFSLDTARLADVSQHPSS
jgi:hypothetical protein